MEVLQTTRCTISLLTLEHSQFILELVNSPSWLRYIGDRNVHSIRDAENYLDNGLLKSQREFGFSYYVVSHNNVPIGVCGFLKKPYLDHVDFGFAYLEQYQGKGFGYEAGTAILDYGIKTFQFAIIDAICLPHNKPSNGLLKKLGFQFTKMVLVPEDKQELCLYQLISRNGKKETN